MRLEVTTIAADDFPVGTGGRFRSTEEFYELLRQVLNLKPTEGIKVSTPGKSKTRACSLRSALQKELIKKHKEESYELVCRTDETETYHLYIRRS